jgi:hypothetical protein
MTGRLKKTLHFFFLGDHVYYTFTILQKKALGYPFFNQSQKYISEINQERIISVNEYDHLIFFMLI